MAKEMKAELIEAKIERIKTLIENLVNAANAGDSTAIEQTAAAGREFLDKNPA